MPKLLAVSDLHVRYQQNRQITESLRPESDGDWLIVAGDVAEFAADVERVLTLLADRFEKVIWAPGNHELWTMPDDPVQLRGDERYRHLVGVCREHGVLTPEDPFAVWQDRVVVAPLFLLYDYSFRAPHLSREEALAEAYEAGVVCTDEFFLHPDPYPDRAAWCRARVEYSAGRLRERPGGLPTVLVNHWPMTRVATRPLWFPQFAQWCGTDLTADWHTRFDAEVVVHGHLHIPRTTEEDGVRFEEVSLGYPREWERRGGFTGLRTIF